MSRSRKSIISKITLLICIFSLGLAVGFAAGGHTWEVVVNGKPSTLPVHVIKNMLFVSLEDLAQLPGWKVSISLGSRKVAIDTPSGGAAGNTETESADSENSSTKTETATTPPKPIEVKNKNSGPPDNVRMTVQAAVGALGNLQRSLDGNLSASDLQKAQDDTSGVVGQAIKLLWSVPRTRTLQADLQVALEELQSQVSLFMAKDQAQDGILPWTHPTAQSLLMRYPDLRPCDQTKEKTEGLDLTCGKNTLSELENEDLQDVQRDLNAY